MMYLSKLGGSEMSEKLLLELYDRVATLENKVAALEQLSIGAITETPDTEKPSEIKSKGKYKNLSDYLANSGKEIVDLTFAEIEEIMQDELPPCAREHRANWSNTTTISLTRSWMSVGYRTTMVDLPNEKVRFEKMEGKKTMSKYDALGQYLEKSGQKKVALTFSEIEEILGFELIESLRKHEVAWYGASEKSPTHVWKKVWCSYGYQVDTVSLDNENVVFYKISANNGIPMCNASVTLSIYEEEIKEVLVAMLNKTADSIPQNPTGTVYYSSLTDFVNAKYGRNHACYGKPIGDMLGRISERCHGLGYPLISAIVVNKNGDGNDRYPDLPTISGFCGIPTIAAKMKSMNDGQKFQFIIDEMAKVKSHKNWFGL